MKRSLLFILLLVAKYSLVEACGFYPYGEDIRFSMFDPELPAFDSYRSFFYSSHFFESDDVHYIEDSLYVSWEDYENLLLWQKKYRQVASLKDIYEVIYAMDQKALDGPTSNSFMTLLHAEQNKATLDYIRFAKTCSALNTYFDDPWERNGRFQMKNRTDLIIEIKKRIQQVKDPELIKRYAFLGIRLSFYNNQQQQLMELYNTYFSHKAKDALDYWSMYFVCSMEADPAKANFLASQVFAYCPGKRYSVYYKYTDSIDVTSSLKWAETNQEKAAVWLMAGIKQPYRTLDCLKEIYRLSPSSEGLSFLLLRELNKLEDWIYTPYYTEFTPSVSQDYPWESDEFFSIYENRIKEDRQYAEEVLQFVAQANLKKVFYPSFWHTANAYLLLMSGNYSQAKSYLTSKRSFLSQDAASDRWNMLKAFALTASQTSADNNLLPFVKQQLLTQFKKRNYRFVFAIARELEMKGNTTEAAILLSTLSNEAYEYDKSMYWRSKKGSYSWNNFYDDYIDYLDFQYTPKQLEQLIQHLSSKQKDNTFNRWAYKKIKDNTNFLYDLLGTKYMRKNNLSLAIKAFRKVPDTLWKSERFQYLDANPFFTDFYHEHRYTEADTIRYNKYQIARKLLDCLRQADNPDNPERDYYYFLAANCYLNMTWYGNSWMMKRYDWTCHLWLREEYGDPDYAQCFRARDYYLKAKRYTKTPMFAALCLRMAGRCEKYRLMSEHRRAKGSYAGYDENQLFNANRYYTQLSKEYPEYYEELISSCEAFERYLATRRPS